jgi:hypothetical protein
MDQITSLQIVEGGCYKPSPELNGRRSSRRWAAVLIFVVLVILGLFIWRRP